MTSAAWRKARQSLPFRCAAAAAGVSIPAVRCFGVKPVLCQPEGGSPKRQASYYGAYSTDKFGGGIGERLGIVEDIQRLPGTAIARVTLVSEQRGKLRQWATASNWRQATAIHKQAYFTRSENLVQEDVLEKVRQHYVSTTEALDENCIKAALYRLEDESKLKELLDVTLLSNIPAVVFGVFNEDKEAYVVDFANKRLGGAWLSYGMVQEEKMFIERFDYGALCARSLLEMPRSPLEEPVASPFSMKQDEAWLLGGGLRYADVPWYGRTPKDGLERLQCVCPVDDDAPPTVLAIDAIKADFKKYEQAHLFMMLVKAYVGFAAAKEDPELGGATCIATGSWGCGAFFNNERVMFVVQTLAANLAGVNLTYHSLGDGLSLTPAFQFLEEALCKKATVGQVLESLAQKCADDPAWESKWRPPKSRL